MDLKNINHYQTSDLESLKNLSSRINKSSLSESSSQLLQAAQEAQDSYESEFQVLKKEISRAEEPGRQEFVQAIKNMVESGKYKVGSSDIADALLNDGFAELIV